MPVRYVIDREWRVIVTTGEGRVTFSEIKDHQNRLLKDPAFDPNFNQLIDVTTATEMDLTDEEAHVVATRPVVSPKSRRAWVATDGAILGMGRLMQGYHGARAVVQIFSDRHAALKWLVGRSTNL